MRGAGGGGALAKAPWLRQGPRVFPSAHQGLRGEQRSSLLTPLPAQPAAPLREKTGPWAPQLRLSGRRGGTWPGKRRARGPDSAPGLRLQRPGSARCGCHAEYAPSHCPPPSRCPLPLQFPFTSHGQDLMLPPSGRGRTFPASLGPSRELRVGSGAAQPPVLRPNAAQLGAARVASQVAALGEPGLQLPRRAPHPHLEAPSPASAVLWRPALQSIPFP